MSGRHCFSSALLYRMVPSGHPYITAIGLVAAVANVGHQAYIPRLRTKTAGEHVAILAGDLRTHSGRNKLLLDGGAMLR